MRTTVEVEKAQLDPLKHSISHPHRQPVPLPHSVWRTSVRFALLTTVALGLAYPLSITAVAQFFFPHQANGSLVVKSGTVIGSELIGQAFTSDRYFHARPSAAGNGYDASASGGSNLAQSNPTLAPRIQGDIATLQKANNGRPVPIDMVTTSASGLDPDITPDNAAYQAPRVAASRGISEESVRNLIQAHTHRRDLGFLGEVRVNVLELNLALDQASSTPSAPDAGK